MRSATIAAVAAALALAGCASGTDPAGAPPPDDSSSPTAPGPGGTSRPDPSTDPSADPTGPAAPSRIAAAAVDADTAVAAVRRLAGRIGPRPGHSPAYFRAAGYVESRLRDLGWVVERQPFRVPGGVSWGVPVDAGRSVNLVATRGDVRPGRPWLAVGAHLDTVPQAPGAEDNGSGVGALLAVAEAAADRRTRLPVVLVAFGAEEPRGPGDDDHHYGSRHFVAGLAPGERRSLRGMLSLDRIGVGDAVVVSSAGPPDAQRARVLAAAERAGVPTAPMTGDRASDHWSFARAGLPGVRIGSTPYAEYHSSADTVGVVDRTQLGRAARLVAAWLR